MIKPTIVLTSIVKKHVIKLKKLLFFDVNVIVYSLIFKLISSLIYKLP